MTTFGESTPLDIYLSQNDGVPVYLQIINQVKQLVATKRLVPDQELPAIRVLAEQLLINPNTVARAYRELESSGWVYKRRGAGTFISDKPSPLSQQERQRVVDEKILSLLAEAQQMEITVEQIITRIKQIKAKVER
jgi:DNA-binding transcriptional regulator YhcF (GntR family)